MRKNKAPLIIITAILLISMVAGCVVWFVDKDGFVDKNDTSISDTNQDEGECIVDFDERNEVFLDPNLIPYLERMEKGVPTVDDEGNYYLYNDGNIVYNASQEKDVDGVLNNIILLINYFAKENYSMDASRQIQRFYIEYYERFANMPFEKMVSNIAKCFPKEGADPDNLNDKVIKVFGINRGDECDFVFTPLTFSEIKVEFYNVLPLAVDITEKMKSLCIYDSWHNEEDDGYERNLEAWLHNVIKATSETELSEAKIIVAQIVYAGSIADAEYRPDWADALVKCLFIEDWNYDNLKLAVESAFGVCLDYNVPIQEYFASLDMEVIE